MGRVGNFIRKLLPMLHEHFLKQKQNPLLALAYLRNMSSRKTLSSELTSKNGSFELEVLLPVLWPMLSVPFALARDMTTVMRSFLELLKTYDDLLKASSAVNPTDFIPCMFIALHVQDHLTTYDKDHIQAITDALINACHNKYAVAKTTTLNDDEIISTVSDLFGAVFIFGTGIRKCLGEEVARNEVFVFITTVLQQLTLKKSPGVALDLKPMYGLVMKPKPDQLQAESRSM
ncbi:hypothetical protein Celaphus_00018373, partial [Cervus elaphus hippelaphus]